MLLLEVALCAPNSAVELEPTTIASLPDTLPFPDAERVLNAGHGVPDSHSGSQ